MIDSSDGGVGEVRMLQKYIEIPNLSGSHHFSDVCLMFLFLSHIQEKVLLVDVFFIDRHLLRLIDHHQYLPANHTEMNVRIDVGIQSGSWIVKCRNNRTIVNNR
jgi:hypothetical protein